MLIVLFVCVLNTSIKFYKEKEKNSRQKKSESNKVVKSGINFRGIPSYFVVLKEFEVKKSDKIKTCVPVCLNSL